MRDRFRSGGRAIIVSHSYYTRDTRFRRHAEALAGAGWSVDVLCARDEGEPARDRLGAVTIRRLPARRRRGSKGRYAFEYASFVAMAFGALASARRPYDLVYVFSIPNILVRVAAVPRMRGARVFLDVRDPMPEFFRSRYGLAPDHRLVRALLVEERNACRYAHRVVTVHDSLAALLSRTGVPTERIGVVMNAPDPRIFAFNPGAARDPADRTLLYTGTVSNRYGVDLVVRAVARLRDKIPALRFRIVGDGDAVPGLERLAAELGIDGRVVFDGPTSLDRIPAIVTGSWLGVQPHRSDPLMSFCFSTKVLEWGALGLPVVCSRTEAFDRSFSEDELLFVRPGDLDDLCSRILEAHENPERLADRAVRTRESMRRFDWARERQTLLRMTGGGEARRGDAEPSI